MLVVVDYGLGNLRSIQHKLTRSGIDAQVSSNAKAIAEADLLILPGVGHFATGMRNLKKTGLVEVLTEMVLERRIPVMGICLGLQLMAKWSEEGDVEGLGWIDASVQRFQFNEEIRGLKIPNIGWNTVTFARSSPLCENIAPDQRFYFVHSYHLCCDHAEDILGRSRYGYEFTSVVHRDNIFGTQFHPEKSHRHGMQLVKNFVNFHTVLNPE